LISPQLGVLISSEVCLERDYLKVTNVSWAGYILKQPFMSPVKSFLNAFILAVTMGLEDDPSTAFIVI
jgi:hypothetical protein